MAIERYSGEFGANPWIMASLIRVESTGNPRAKSQVGARGLTQVMPRTGRWIAQELGVPWKGSKMLYDVEVNVRFGTFYYQHLLNKFEGDVAIALAAYNWGPTDLATYGLQAAPAKVKSYVAFVRDRSEGFA